MKREFTVIIEKDEDGYFVGTVPELHGCHTQAKSLDELMERMKEAVLLCLEGVGDEISAELEFIGVQKIAV
jgi:predicted RNase H-like HicB family nuclease